MQKLRLEKDLQELQALIDKHFKQRKADDQELKELATKIEVRKEERAKAMEQRQKRDQERLQREKEERQRREEEEKQKKLEEEERKREALQQMSATAAGRDNRERRGGGTKRQTEKEKKRKVLAERRKPLNVDHLDRDKIVVKIKELYDYLFNLEGIKYDYEGDVLDRQKYEITQRRARAQRYSEKLLGRKQMEREKARKQKKSKVSLLK